MKLKIAGDRKNGPHIESDVEHIRRENAETKDRLLVARSKAEVWQMIVDTDPCGASLDDFEALILDAVVTCWGFGAMVEIDRGKKQIIARHARGLSMDLVTGEIL